MNQVRNQSEVRIDSLILRIATHVIGFVPLLLLILDILRGRLTANPIQYLEQRTGYAALIMLVLTLAISPISNFSGHKFIQKGRRTMGLYSFLYAALHFLIFTVIDYSLNWELLKEAIFKKPYALVGFSAFVILLALAITSFDWSKRWLKKNWKRLHALIYLAAPLVALHYAWAKKADIFRLKGDIFQSLVFAGILAVLLLLRLPPIKHKIVQGRMRLTVILNGSKAPQ